MTALTNMLRWVPHTKMQKSKWSLPEKSLCWYALLPKKLEP